MARAIAAKRLAIRSWALRNRALLAVLLSFEGAGDARGRRGICFARLLPSNNRLLKKRRPSSSPKSLVGKMVGWFRFGGGLASRLETGPAHRAAVAPVWVNL